MYGVHARMLLRHLLDVEGRSQSAAAREVGVNRSTLRRWIRAGLLDTELDEIRTRYGPRPAVRTRLDPVKPLLAERLEEFPALTARRLLPSAAPPDTPAAIRSSVSTSGRSVRSPSPSRSSAAKHQRDIRRRSTSPIVDCRGVFGMRCWWS